MALHHNPKLRTGFSLVELAIVLVILGLLVGGILTGKTLIHASELRTISTQYNNYYAATRAFRDKYFALPGDMTNATSFWGEADAVPAICVFTASTDARTCNGNGNNKIGSVISLAEGYRAWQHLANAGLVEGRYDGVNALTSSPQGKITRNYWFMIDLGSLTSETGYFDGQYDNSLIYAGPPSGGPLPFGVNLTATDVWNIDSKMDDGKPDIGKVVMVGGTGTGGLSDCSTAASAPPPADYLLTGTSTDCGIVFRQQF